MNEGKTIVFGFGIKLVTLYGSGINPKVYNDSTLAVSLGIAREAVRQIKNKERPSKSENPSPDASNTETELTQSRLASIATVFGIPMHWFSDKCSKKEFERRLRESTWSRLINLKSSAPLADFKFEISRHRGLIPADLVKDKPELGNITLNDRLTIQFQFEKRWRVILLERQPNGAVLSLLPSQWFHHCSLDDQGSLTIPNLKFSANDTGQHTFVAIFHEQPFFGAEVKSDWFYSQLSADIQNTEPERTEAALRKLVNWLEDQQKLRPPCFEVIIKECQVVSG